jgi:hypothetical protein
MHWRVLPTFNQRHRSALEGLLEVTLPSRQTHIACGVN